MDALVKEAVEKGGKISKNLPERGPEPGRSYATCRL